MIVSVECRIKVRQHDRRHAYVPAALRHRRHQSAGNKSGDPLSRWRNMIMTRPSRGGQSQGDEERSEYFHMKLRVEGDFALLVRKLLSISAPLNLSRQMAWAVA